ncbi:transcription termination factor 1 isoform X1 [Pelobates cultripes]|uniref:Transcription termination factor 1 isoform X1 n=1 Tax=Pelobates cultripes TaxID=61616 RepID=A0AAD1WLC4_PELCU|nr:transcription termination factor 1 isoform X1 [Pelobates cultripes]
MEELFHDQSLLRDQVKKNLKSPVNGDSTYSVKKKKKKKKRHAEDMENYSFVASDVNENIHDWPHESTAQNLETTHDESQVTQSAKKRKKIKHPESSTTDFIEPEESENTAGNEQDSSTTNDHQRAKLDLPDDAALREYLKDPVSVKKKKKRRADVENSGFVHSHNGDHVNETIHDGSMALNSEADSQVTQSAKKHKKKRVCTSEDMENTHIGNETIHDWPGDSTYSEDPSCVKKKKKKKKRHAEDMENYSFVASDVNENIHDWPHESTAQNLETTHDESQVTQSAKKRKKKKRPESSTTDFIEPEESENTAGNEQDSSTTNNHQRAKLDLPDDAALREYLKDPVSVKKKKKRRADVENSGFVHSHNGDHVNETIHDGSMALNSEADCDNSQVTQSAKKHKKKRVRTSEDMENTHIGDSTYSEDPSPGKKKKKRHTEDMENYSFVTSDVNESIRDWPNESTAQNLETTHDESQVTQRAKKGKKKKVPLTDVIEPEESENTIGNEQDSSTANVPEPDNAEDLKNKSKNKGDPSKKIFWNRLSLRKQDLELMLEYFPRLMKLSQSRVTNLFCHELERVKAAKRKGISFNTGRFTLEENKQLHENVKEFMFMSGVDSEEKLFHSYRFPEEQRFIQLLKKQYNFKERIGTNIPRPLTEISHRGEKMFDLSSQKGRFSAQEVHELKKQMQLHGNKWRIIRSSIDRSSIGLQLKASQLRRETNTGTWGADEINRLIEAVKEFILTREKTDTSSGDEAPVSIAKQQLYKGIPWVQMEEKVNTRNWSQCKTKWMEILLSRMNFGVSPFEGITGLCTRIKMIKWLYDNRISESGLINWEEFAEFLGNIPPMMLQIKVYALKAEYINRWQDMTFQEIVNHLHSVIIPAMEAKLEIAKAKKKDIEYVFEKKKDYLPSEIFYEYTEKRYEKAD